jgi:hypothetical protein
MGLFNNILHTIGARSDSDWNTHRAYERGDITRETRNESLRDNYRRENDSMRENTYQTPVDHAIRGANRFIR